MIQGRAVFRLFDYKNVVTLKSGSVRYQKSLKVVLFYRFGMVS